MDYRLNSLKKVGTEYLVVSGSDYTIEDKETRQVYVSSKGNLNKLFKEMGYRNVNVINILEEFAGKVISNVGELTNSSVYIDTNTDSFIVSSDHAVDWFNKMVDLLEGEGIKITDLKHYNNYYEWDQYELCTLSGDKFIMYLNLVGEYVKLYSVAESDGVVYGVNDLGSYKFGKEGSLDDFIDVITTSSLEFSDFNLDDQVSIEEYLNLMIKLGFIDKKRKNYVLTEEGEHLNSEIDIDLDEFIDTVNSMTWIQRHINAFCDNYGEVCTLINDYLNKIMIYQISDFYMNNLYEKSDLRLLNNY